MLQFQLKSGKPENQKTDCAVIAWFEKEQLPSDLKALDKACGGVIDEAARRGDLEPRSGKAAMLTPSGGSVCRRILVVGAGKRKDFDRAAYRKLLSSAAIAIAGTGAREAVSYLPAPGDSQDGGVLAADTVQAVEQALYRYDTLKSRKNRRPLPALKRFGLAVPDRQTRNQAKAGLERARAIAEGVRLARDLGNTPANICTPRYLASAARKIAARSSKATAKVMGPAEMKRLGMGALLSVAAGAREPARLIVVQYRGDKASARPVVLVGKGITFDTGGISLKPGQGMDEMKFDMCGAAGVLGAIQALIDLGVKKNVVAIVPACVNMPDGGATNPGDVVKSMSGQSVEILNTDAEGRLILCDALTYARRFKPESIVDVATLTGACVIALGPHLTGLMSDNEDLAAALLAAGEKAGDRAWRLPLMPEYAEGLASNFADFANVGGREGGASIAAAFLAKFTEGLHWAHLDVAGSAWKTGKEKGATGRPVGLLVEYVLSQA